MKTSNSCSCHSESDPCGAVVLERPRYYAGELLTEAEMTLEQQYFRDKLRRHNRLLHGWGVVCGAEVCFVLEEAEPETGKAPKDTGRVAPGAERRRKKWKVCVKPGYILGPYGDEILIACEKVVDVRSLCVEGETEGCGEPVDPWCVDVFVQREPGRPLYVVVRYKEQQSRPVRVQPAGCGCDETQCEYSRWRDGYEICMLTEFLPSHHNPPKFEDPFHGPLPACPECPAEPWVVLAQVDVDAEGNITGIDNCACRRLVASFGSFWWECTAGSGAVHVDKINLRVQGDGPVRQGSDFTLVVTSDHELPQQVQVNLGLDVTLKSATLSADRTSVEVVASVAANAPPGPRAIEILDTATNRPVARVERAFTIAPRDTGGGGNLPPSPPPPEPLPRPRPTPEPSPEPRPTPEPGQPQPDKGAKPRRGRGRVGEK